MGGGGGGKSRGRRERGGGGGRGEEEVQSHLFARLGVYLHHGTCVEDVQTPATDTRGTVMALFIFIKVWHCSSSSKYGTVHLHQSWHCSSSSK